MHETIVSLHDKTGRTNGESADDNAGNHFIGRLANSTNVVKSPKANTLNTVLTVIIPILQLIIGWRYSDECPINPKIPTYLIVAGAVGIANIVITHVRGHLTTKGMQSSRENVGDETGGAGTIVRNRGIILALIVIGCLLTVFLFVWFIFGCFWIFGVWSDVQYVRADQVTFCSPVAYRFAYILIGIPLLFLLCCCPLCVATTAIIASATSNS